MYIHLLHCHWPYVDKLLQNKTKHENLVLQEMKFCTVNYNLLKLSIVDTVFSQYLIILQYVVYKILRMYYDM